MGGLTASLCAAVVVVLALGCGEQTSSSAGGERSGDADGKPSVSAGEQRGGSGGRSGDEQPPPGWTAYRSGEWGYAVSFPERWRRAAESLTPALTEPREILSLGTFPLSYADSECAHLPTSALERMTEQDVFLTIQERGADPQAEWLDFPPRPDRFAFEPGRSSEASACVRGPVRFVDHWFAFTDGQRHFHVEVALGKSAPPALRQEAYRILDTLRFDPDVRPDWRASG